MFKRLLSTLMLSCLFVVQANAASNNSLKKAFDEFNYSVTVEWDQKDQTVYNTAVNKFQKVLKGLQAQGLTNEELVKFAKTRVLDAKLGKDLDTLMKTVEVNKMNESDARKYVLGTMDSTVSQGASWSGDGLVVGIVVVALILVIVVAASTPTSGTGGGYYGGSDCSDEYVCYDYYDDYGYWYSDCYWETYCY
jgi:Skp family chaperone for outer membrane proteins